MKRYFVYDPMNRDYGNCYKSKKAASDSIKNIRKIYTKEKAEGTPWMSKSLAKRYKYSYEYWSRVIVRECEVTAIKDYKA